VAPGVASGGTGRSVLQTGPFRTRGSPLSKQGGMKRSCSHWGGCPALARRVSTRMPQAPSVASPPRRPSRASRVRYHQEPLPCLAEWAPAPPQYADAAR
jgi:hypothetical protein